MDYYMNGYLSLNVMTESNQVIMSLHQNPHMVIVWLIFLVRISLLFLS